MLTRLVATLRYALRANQETTVLPVRTQGQPPDDASISASREPTWKPDGSSELPTAPASVMRAMNQ